MFNIPDIKKIKGKYPILKAKIEELLASSMMKSEQRIYSFISMEAKDRYMLIMKEQPELIKSKRQLTFSLQLKLQLFASCIYQFVSR